jgi:hypothetical protein
MILCALNHPCLRDGLPGLWLPKPATINTTTQVYQLRNTLIVIWVMELGLCSFKKQCEITACSCWNPTIPVPGTISIEIRVVAFLQERGQNDEELHGP